MEGKRFLTPDISGLGKTVSLRKKRAKRGRFGANGGMAKSRKDRLFDGQFLARLQQLHLIAKRLSARDAGGARRSRHIGDGLEFADHRSYMVGDDIRFIDWPYYARMEGLLLRLFHERSEADVIIMLDASASMAPGQATDKFDYALRVAAALAFVAMGGLERVIVQPFAEDLAPPLRTGRNRGQILEVLDFLVELAPGGRTDLDRCADRLARSLDAPASVLLVSDLLDCGDDLSDAVVRLKGRGCDVTALHVYSPLDANPALAGPVILQQAETHQNMPVDVTDDVRASYRRRWREMCDALARTAASRGPRTSRPRATFPLSDWFCGRCGRRASWRGDFLHRHRHRHRHRH